MNLLKHRFTSAKTDGADATQVQPSHWNDGHAFSGGNAGDVLTRDPTDALYGAIWAPPAVPPPAVATVIPSTDTGTVNDWAPAGLAGKNAVINWSGAGNLTVTGIAGFVSGQIVFVKNRGTGIIFFPHFSSGSAGGNRFVNFATSGPTPIAVNGAAQFIYLAAAWYLVVHEQGDWITPTYSAADYFGGGSQTWTVPAGSVQAFVYRLSGKTLSLSWSLSNTSIGGTADAELRRTMPNGFVIGGTTGSLFSFSNNGTTGAGEVLFTNAAAVMNFRRAIFSGSTNWGASSSQTDLRGAAAVTVT